MEDYTDAQKLLKDYVESFSEKINKFDSESAAAKSIIFK